MSNKIVKFGDKEITKSEFYDNKNHFEIDSTDVNKIKVSQKISYDEEMSFKTFDKTS